MSASQTRVEEGEDISDLRDLGSAVVGGDGTVGDVVEIVSGLFPVALLQPVDEVLLDGATKQSRCGGLPSHEHL